MPPSARPIDRLSDLKGHKAGMEYLDYWTCVLLLLQTSGLTITADRQDLEMGVIGNAYFEELFRRGDGLRLFATRSDPYSPAMIRRGGGLQIRFLSDSSERK